MAKRIKKRQVFAAFMVLFVLIIYILSRSKFLEFRDYPRNIERRLELATGYQPILPGYIDHKGKELHYVQVGDQEKPLLFFVHGSPGSCTAYMPYLEDSSLLNQFQMMAVDRPGFGYSQFGKAEPSLTNQMEAMVPLLQQAGAVPKILVGHSLGGPLIVKLAMDYPELVSALILIAPSVDPELEPREWWRKPLNWFFIRWLLPPSLRVSNQEIMFLYQELEKMDAHWQKVSVPVSVLHGDQDGLVPVGNVEYAEHKLKHIEHFRKKIIPGNDHFILWSKSHLVKQEALQILSIIQKDTLSIPE